MNNEKTFEQYQLTEPYELKWFDPDAYLPDNDYAIYFNDEYGRSVIMPSDYSSTYLRGKELLYPGTTLADFGVWSIGGTDNILGRDCVHTVMQIGNYLTENWVDLRTGIVMKEIITGPDESTYSEITELTLNEPVEHKTYDLTGYTRNE